MKKVIINCAEINSRYQLHEKLADALSFPEWYGRNLDALHDILTDFSEDTLITFSNFVILEENLGRYALLLKKVVLDASEENEKVHIEII